MNEDNEETTVNVTSEPFGHGFTVALSQPQGLAALALKLVVEGIAYSLIGLATAKVVGSVSERISSSDEDNVTPLHAANE